MSKDVNATAAIRPGISAGTLTRLGIRHVDEAEALDLIGQRFTGLYIPYGVHVNGHPFGRLRLDVPQADRKYTQRAESGVHPYIPALPSLESQGDLVLVEGEFKAIALCEAGFRAIGLSGFYGFMHEDRLCLRLAKHLKDHPAKRLLFLGDNDTALNFQFADAAVKLTALVDATPVLLPRIPLSRPKGVDDCREQLGTDAFPAWWQTVVASALPAPPKLKADMLAVELFKLALPDLRMLSGIERGLMLQKLGRLASCLQPMARSELAALCKSELGVSKATLQQAAMLALQSQEQQRTVKEEWKAVAQLYGDAMFMGHDGKCITGLNERFWTGLLKQQHLLLHEPEEERFYRYEDTTGLWRPQTRATLEQLTCDTVNAETDGDAQCLKHAQITFARAVVRHLEGMNERANAFREAPQGIHVANGYLVIGADALELQSFSPSHYSRNRSPIGLSVRLSGDVSAWRRRLRILHFKKSATARPTIVNFDKKLLEQEGAGILNWAILGAAQVLADVRAERERPLSPAQKQRLENLLGQSDPMRHFLETSVEKRKGGTLEKNDVLEAYADCCGEQGWEPLPDLTARKELNNRMLELFGSVERKSAGAKGNQRGYSHVAFKEDDEASDPNQTPNDLFDESD